MATSIAVDNDTSSPRARPDQLSLVAIVVMLVAHLPLLLRLSRRMWALEHYRFFPLILMGAGYLAYSRWPFGLALTPGRGIWRMVLSVTSALMLSLAILTDSPWFAAISAMVTLWTCIYLIGGRELLSRLWPAWAFLWLAVPLPMGLDRRMILGLQHLATNWASGVLDLAGYRHLVSGVVLELPQRSFEVEEACSGIHSLFAALACTVFYSILLRRGILRIIVLMVATVFYVLFVNAARVTLITIVCSRWDLPIADGVGHDLVGVLAFAITLLLIASTDRLLMLLFPYPFRLRRWRRRRRKHRKRRAKSATAPSAQEQQLAPVPAAESPAAKEAPAGDGQGSPILRWELIALLVVFGGLGLAQFATAGLLGLVRPDWGELTQVSQASATSLPQQVAGWTQVKFESVQRDADDPNGEFSKHWHYQIGNHRAVVSVDGPFVGWHDLGSCLEGQGWSTQDSRVCELTEANQGEQRRTIPKYVQMRVRKALSQHAGVMYAVFDQQNRHVEPPSTYMTFRVIRRFPKLANLLVPSDPDLARPDSTTFQVQVFQETTKPPNAQETQLLESLFKRAVAEFTKQDFTSSQL